MGAPVPEPNPTPTPAPDPTPDAPTPGGAPEPPPAPQGPTRMRVLNFAEAARELARLRVAGITGPAAIGRLRGRGMLLPVGGGSPEGDGGSGSGAGDGGQGGSSGDAGAGDGGSGGASSGAGDGGSGDAGWTPPTREEYEAQQKALGEANKRARTLERQQTEAQRKAAEEAGNFEELHKQSSAELERVKGLVASAAKRDAVAEVAARLRFRNPNIAHKLIDLGGIEATLDLEGDEPSATVDSAGKATIESRLQAVAQADSYLLGDAAAGQLAGAGASTGAGGTGSGGGNGDGNAAMNAAIRRAAGRG